MSIEKSRFAQEKISLVYTHTHPIEERFLNQNLIIRIFMTKKHNQRKRSLIIKLWLDSLVLIRIPAPISFLITQSILLKWLN